MFNSTSKEPAADALDIVECIEIEPDVADAETSAAPNTSGGNAEPQCEFCGVNISQRSQCKRKSDSSSQSDELFDIDKGKRRCIRCKFGSSSSSEEVICLTEEQNVKSAPLNIIEMIFPDTREREFMQKVLQHILSPVSVSKISSDKFLWSALELDLNHGALIGKIIKSLRLNQILKSPLSPNPLNSSLEPVELPCTWTANAWKNNVNHPAVCAKDLDIKRIVDSALVDLNHCKKQLNDVLTDLNEWVKIEGFTNTWHWFGSYLTGVVTRDDDIQLHFECVPNEINIEVAGNVIFEKALTRLKVKPVKFYKPEGHMDTPSPWILAGSRSTGKNILIMFSNDFNSAEMNVAKSLLMKLYLDISPTLKYLFVIVEIIFQNFIFNVFYVRNNSYLIFWLVVFFMQHKKLLPAVIDIRRAAKTKHYVDGWDCSLPESYSYPTEPVSLYALLVQFFEFCEKFDFLNCLICPYLGCVFRLSDFERLKIPTEEFSLYLRQQNNPSRLTFIRSIINLQDPSDLCYNVAELMLPNRVRIFNAFKFLCHRLSQLFPSSIEEMEKMNCLFKMPQDENFAAYVPHNLTQYSLLILRTDTIFKTDTSRRRKLNQMYILEAIRKIMESIFSFKKKSIVISQNITQRTANYRTSNIYGKLLVERTFPVIYFEYCSSDSTWKNQFTKEIISRKEDENNQIKIFLTCEVCLDFERPTFKIFIQGDSRFVMILQRHYLELLRFTLNEIIIVKDVTD